VSGYSQPRPIWADDDLALFDCGEPSLNEYLRNRAYKNDQGGASRCYVTLRDGRVVGYYAVAMASIQQGSAPGKVRRNMPDTIPAILLSRLATDRKEQGQGLGANLLRDAITKAVEASRIIGARCLLVHALNNNAAAFYAHFGFIESPTDPFHLLLLRTDAEKLVNGPA
jgi:GNAT superfamily N-acetyltransferase